jgi:L-rhamnonate dehydratase
MKITAVRVLRLSGTMHTDGPLWEERLVRPIDIYPEYRSRNDFEGGSQTDPNHFRVEQFFVRIETDEGPLGIAGPLPELVAAFVAKLTPIQEYLVKWNAINQHFLAHPITPQQGHFTPPDQPGLGMDLDTAKIEAQAEI